MVKINADVIEPSEATSLVQEKMYYGPINLHRNSLANLTCTGRHGGTRELLYICHLNGELECTKSINQVVNVLLEMICLRTFNSNCEVTVGSVSGVVTCYVSYIVFPLLKLSTRILKYRKVFLLSEWTTVKYNVII